MRVMLLKPCDLSSPHHVHYHHHEPCELEGAAKTFSGVQSHSNTSLGWPDSCQLFVLHRNQKNHMSDNGLLISTVFPPQKSLLPRTGFTISYTVLWLSRHCYLRSKTFQLQGALKRISTAAQGGGGSFNESLARWIERVVADHAADRATDRWSVDVWLHHHGSQGVRPAICLPALLICLINQRIQGHLFEMNWQLVTMKLFVHLPFCPSLLIWFSLGIIFCNFTKFLSRKSERNKTAQSCHLPYGPYGPLRAKEPGLRAYGPTGLRAYGQGPGLWAR